jgi:hypothetical protein
MRVINTKFKMLVFSKEGKEGMCLDLGRQDV